MSKGLMANGFSIGRVHVLEQQILVQSDIERLLEAEDISQMIHILTETVFAPFVSNINDEKDIEEALAGYLEDLHVLSNELLGTVKKNKIPLFAKLARTEIDLANIRIFLRQGVSEEFVEDGFIAKENFKSEDVKSEIKRLYPSLGQKLIDKENINDKNLDDIILSMLKQYKHQPIIADRIIAFLKAKQLEVKNVRLILLAGLNKITKEQTQNNLRILYA